MLTLRKLSLMTLATCSTVLCMASVETALAYRVAGSTYQSSCWNLEVDGDMLSASCRTKDSQALKSSIRIYGIDNYDGELTFTNLNRASNYQWSCWNLEVDGDVLSADCRTRNGSSRRSSIGILGIENRNGNLSYRYVIR